MIRKTKTSRIFSSLARREKAATKTGADASNFPAARFFMAGDNTVDQNKALNSLLECADLIAMLDDLMASKNGSSAASVSGVRITLRNIREHILAGHDSLAQILISKKAPETAAAAQSNGITSVQSVVQQAQNPAFQRKDLRATIEKVLDNS